MDTDRERHRAKETANTICFIMHKSSGNKTHPMKKKINSPVVEKRNKAPAEEQRTSTSRGTNNQQRKKELAPAEEQRTSTSRGSKKQQMNKEPEMREEMRAKYQFVCVGKKVKQQLRSTFWLKSYKFLLFHLPKSASKKLKI
ncbi:hypothetical protein ES319_D05G341300v1 [Gossypium barbadense]|uniref:Uncharacterized protein n=4 Tax=Gossypium TaxID=3633 RepID=A0A5J5RL21_GOSBA|nr:hypothetical protein ES319_D05G341300v1 [Gossypium barbadense]TYG71028.1 hypothetical protein ES288_D05G361600v1 [Gossypium darwinii]